MLFKSPDEVGSIGPFFAGIGVDLIEDQIFQHPQLFRREENFVFMACEDIFEHYVVGDEYIRWVPLYFLAGDKFTVIRR